MHPLVSVIMPAYNAEQYIGEAIESILRQSYENIELIVIDDGSNDNTEEITKSFKDKRLYVYFNEKNKGISYTTNRGIEKSNGKYIALMDDDDIAEEKRIEIQVDYLETNPQIDILGGRTTFINEHGKVLFLGEIPRYNPKYIRAVLLFNCMDFMNSTAMIRKDFIIKNNLSYEEECFGMQDFKFYIESSKVGNISTVSDFLLKHRIHSNNETEKNFRLFERERAEKYAEFQRYSIKKSGFILLENELQFINKVLSERGGKCETREDLCILYDIFTKLIGQAKKMDLDYTEELVHLFKVKISEQIMVTDLF